MDEDSTVRMALKGLLEVTEASGKNIEVVVVKKTGMKWFTDEETTPWCQAVYVVLETDIAPSSIAQIQKPTTSRPASIHSSCTDNECQPRRCTNAQHGALDAQTLSEVPELQRVKFLWSHS